MGWQEVVFERELLYKEVWVDPVRAVAERHGISDVGLRKICQKLGVPMPPLGYWARVEAGQTPRVTPLPTSHKGPTTHIRRVHVDEAAPERERRTACLLAENKPGDWPTVVVPETLDDCHAVIRRTTKHLSSRSGDQTKSAFRRRTRRFHGLCKPGTKGAGASCTARMRHGIGHGGRSSHSRKAGWPRRTPASH